MVQVPVPDALEAWKRQSARGDAAMLPSDRAKVVVVFRGGQWRCAACNTGGRAAATLRACPQCKSLEGFRSVA